MALGHGHHGGGTRGGAFVDNSGYYDQPVDVQPYGNTISVTCPSDNPFEDDAKPCVVVTQQSGGMAGPDPRMQSKRIITKQKRTRTNNTGQVMARHFVAS